MKTLKKFLAMAFVGLAALTFTSCGDDEPDGGDSGSGGGSGKVNITSITFGNKVSGKYTTRVTVTASGVSASAVKDIGVKWGKTSAANQNMSGTKGTTSTTRVLSLSANTTYYAMPYLTTSSGTKTGSKKTIKVPK